MNAQQRKQARKQKRLVMLGREAQVQIAAAGGQADRALHELATRDSELAKTLSKAKTLEEAVMLARVEATKAAAELDLAMKEAVIALAEADEAHKLTLEATTHELEQKHARELEALQAARRSDNEAATAAVVYRNERISKLKAELEEPAKLRQRLQASQQKVAELQTEIHKLKAQIPPEPVHVPFIHRRRAP